MIATDKLKGKSPRLEESSCVVATSSRQINQYLAALLVPLPPYVQNFPNRIISDAHTQILPLATLGGGEPQHDWAFLLGKLGLLHADHTLAWLTRALGFVSMLFFLLMGSYQLWLMFSLPKRKGGGRSQSVAEDSFEVEAIPSLHEDN